MQRAVLASIVVASAVAATLAARQARDPGTPAAAMGAPSGTGVLSGLVVTDEPTPRLARRVTMRLSGAASGRSTRLVGTDDDGRFRFDKLPAGSYTLSATKPGYVETFYGSKHPGRGPGILITVADDKEANVTLRIVPGAAIAGLITDATGRAAPGVPVVGVQVGRGGAPPAPARATTDDRGMYRLFGLAPGDYLVSALPRLDAGGRRGSAGVDILSVTDTEVQWARRSNDLSGGNAPSPGRPVAYAPVYFPGTPDIAAASPVSVGTGDERSGVDLSLRIVPMSKIGGTIVDPQGQPVAAVTVSLFPRRSDRPSAADALVSSGALVLPRATVSPSGFSIAGVAPGEYTLVARSGSSQRGAPPPPGSITSWCVSDVSVDGRDQTNLVLQLLPGTRMSGSIVFERSALVPPGDLSSIDLSLATPGSSLGAASAPRAIVDAKGAFRFSGVAPGLYSLKAMPPSASGGRWTLKSAIVSGRDVADGLLEIKPGENLDGLVITFSDRGAEIAGRLLDAAGGAATRYSIVAFTTDKSLWLSNSRRIRATPPSTDGSFTIAGLPPGEYAIAVSEDVEPSDLADPAFLSQLLAASYTVTVREGEKKRQNLRVGR